MYFLDFTGVSLVLGKVGSIVPPPWEKVVLNGRWLCFVNVHPFTFSLADIPYACISYIITHTHFYRIHIYIYREREREREREIEIERERERERNREREREREIYTFMRNKTCNR